MVLVEICLHDNDVILYERWSWNEFRIKRVITQNADTCKDKCEFIELLFLRKLVILLYQLDILVRCFNKIITL
jgi:hypothetical protein